VVLALSKLAASLSTTFGFLLLIIPIYGEKKGIEHSLEIVKSPDDRFKYQQKLKELEEVLS